MKQAAILFILLALCAAAAEMPAPIIFGQGVISTSKDEYGETLTPDGKTIYFTMRAPSTSSPSLIMICSSQLINGKWTMPQIVPFSGRYRDTRPSLNFDGSKLFFVSNRPDDQKGLPKADLDIWMVKKENGRWNTPTKMGPPINSDAAELFASEVSDGTIYFCSARPDGSKGSYDIYRSRLRDGKYEEAENLGDAINTVAPELDFYVAPDQSYIIFTSVGRDDEIHGVHHPDYDQGDLYISHNRNGQWTPAKNLGQPINSAASENAPFVSADGRWFFFSSERGFATPTPLPHRITYQELQRELHSVLNGRGNIYQIDAAALR